MDWNRIEAKRNEGGDFAAVAVVPDAIARKIRHAKSFQYALLLSREGVSFEAIVKNKIKVNFLNIYSSVDF